MSSTEKLSFINPATGQKFGEMPADTAEDVRQAVADMRHAAKTWSAKSAAERVWALNLFKAYMIDRADEIAAVLNQDCGKTMQDGLTEVLISVDTLTQIIKHAPEWLRRRSVPRGLYLFKRYFVEPQPFGVTAVIGPWNYPLVQVMTPVFAALAAGNTVVIKPSEVAPAVGRMMEKLFAEFPEMAPYVRVVHGGPEVGKALVAAPPDLIFVTGSEPTAKHIMRAAVDNLTPVISELGGKDAMIVLEDADIKQAAKWGVWGAYYHSGQVCMSVERVYVVDAVYDKFVSAVKDETARFQIGYTADPDSPFNCGPITFEKQVETIEDHLQDAVDKGAKIVTGGKRRGMFVEPTVLVNVNHSMKAMREETFGPTMPIMKVKDEAEAIELANDSKYGLCAYVWSSNLRRAERVARRLNVGTVLVNDAMSHYAVAQLPFGGVKRSGNGRIHGRQEVMQFTQTKGYAIGQPPSPLDIATIFRAPGQYHNLKQLMRFVFGSWSQRWSVVEWLLNGRPRTMQTEPSAPQAAAPHGRANGVGHAGALAATALAAVTIAAVAWRRRRS